MSKTLSIELDDLIYDAVTQLAARNGRSADAWLSDRISDLVQKHPPVSVLSKLDSQEQRACHQIAKSSDRTAEEIAAAWIIRMAPPPRVELSAQERSEQMERLKSVLGLESLGHHAGDDNERIDADLAEYYDADHEE